MNSFSKPASSSRRTSPKLHILFLNHQVTTIYTDTIQLHRRHPPPTLNARIQSHRSNSALLTPSTTRKSTRVQLAPVPVTHSQSPARDRPVRRPAYAAYEYHHAHPVHHLHDLEPGHRASRGVSIPLHRATAETGPRARAAEYGRVEGSRGVLAYGAENL